MSNTSSVKPIRVFAVVDELGNIYGLHQKYVQASTQLKQQNVHQGRIVMLKEILYEISDAEFKEVEFHSEDIFYTKEVTEDEREGTEGNTERN